MKKFRAVHVKASTSDVQTVYESIKLCVRLLKKKRYELNLPKTFLNDLLRNTIIKCGTGRHNCPSAGFRNMTIDLNYWQMDNSAYSEYKAFKSDPVIGAMENVTREDIILLIVAHEISHYVQYTYRNWLPEYLKKDYMKPHGRCFQKIYRYLRADLVNPMIQERRATAAIAA